MSIPKTIPKHKLNFQEDLDISQLSNKTNGLHIITGENGSGKTQLLNFIKTDITQNGKNRETVIFRTTSPTSNTEHIKYNVFRYKNYRNYDDDNNLNSFLNDIINDCRRSLKIDISDIHELENALFSTTNYYHKSQRDNIINSIIKTMEKNNHDFGLHILNEFKTKMGYPTQTDVENVAKEEFKKINNMTKMSSQRKKLFDDWFQKNRKDQEIEWFKEAKEKSSDLKVKQAKLTTWELFLDYFDALFNPFINIDDMFIKLAKAIKENYYSVKKPDKDSILVNINENYLSKVENFKYILKKPHKNLPPELIFQIKHSPIKDSIHLNDLSTGEKALFELCCYKYLAQVENKKIKYILLDEYDANFNPILIDAYLEILKELKKDYKIIITTHNPVTIANAEPEEIFELSREHCTLIHAKDKKGKKKILEKLAPHFVVEDELGFIGILAKTKKDIIIFCEGESDRFYLENAISKSQAIDDKYTIIDCGGADNLKYTVIAFKTVPTLTQLVKHKKILALFDFDKQGFHSCQNIYGAEFNNNNYKGKVKKTDNMYCMLLTPPNYNDYNISSEDKSYTIEHLHISNDKNYKVKKLLPKDKKDLKEKVKQGKYTNFDKFNNLFKEIYELLLT